MRDSALLGISLFLASMASCAPEPAPVVVPIAAPATATATPTASAPPEPPARPTLPPPSTVMRRDDGAPHLRVDAMTDAAATYVGRDIEIDIVEPLRGPETEQERLKADAFHHYQVDSPEGGACEVYLRPPSYRPDDEKTFTLPFDRVVTPPLRARGRLLPAKVGESPPICDFVVAAWWPLDLGKPVVVASPEAVGPELDRKLVELHGEYHRGFEQSAVGRVWVSSARYRQGALPTSPAGDVHIGVLFAKPGNRYGHLGGYRAELFTATAP